MNRANGARGICPPVTQANQIAEQLSAKTFACNWPALRPWLPSSRITAATGRAQQGEASYCTAVALSLHPLKLLTRNLASYRSERGLQFST